MNIKVVVDKDREEEILIYVHKRSELVDKIERLVRGQESLIAKRDRVSYNIELSAVDCFTSDDNKVFARAGKEILEVDEKLYELEETLSESFIKINKSCIANIEKIKSFDASITGTLIVNFKNGYRDYVSRRRLKQVKERLMKK